MIIIDCFGFSGSGKSFIANKIFKKNSQIDNEFLLINKYFIIKRLFFKIFFVSFVKFKEINIILEFQKCFKYKNKKIKYKNLFSFLYLLGYIKYKSKKSKIIILDHGFIQLLLSCYLFSENVSCDFKSIIYKFNNIFSFLNQNFDKYCLVLMDHNWEIISIRLLKRDGSKSNILKDKSNIKFYENALKNCENVYNKLPKEKFKIFASQMFDNGDIDTLLNLLKKS